MEVAYARAPPPLCPPEPAHTFIVKNKLLNARAATKNRENHFNNTKQMNFSAIFLVGVYKLQASTTMWMTMAMGNGWRMRWNGRGWASEAFSNQPIYILFFSFLRRPFSMCDKWLRWRLNWRVLSPHSVYQRWPCPCHAYLLVFGFIVDQWLPLFSTNIYLCFSFCPLVPFIRAHCFFFFWLCFPLVGHLKRRQQPSD